MVGYSPQICFFPFTCTSIPFILVPRSYPSGDNGGNPLPPKTYLTLFAWVTIPVRMSIVIE